MAFTCLRPTLFRERNKNMKGGWAQGFFAVRVGGGVERDASREEATHPARGSS
jgi:hypothetical protein